VFLWPLVYHFTNNNDLFTGNFHQIGVRMTSDHFLGHLKDAIYLFIVDLVPFICNVRMRQWKLQKLAENAV
jgi:hypothetical protein